MSSSKLMLLLIVLQKLQRQLRLLQEKQLQKKHSGQPSVPTHHVQLTTATAAARLKVVGSTATGSMLLLVAEVEVEATAVPRLKVEDVLGLLVLAVLAVLAVVAAAAQPRPRPKAA